MDGERWAGSGRLVLGRRRAGKELHLAFGAVELETKPLAVVVEVERARVGVGMLAETYSEFVADAVFGCHEGFAVVLSGFFKSVFNLLHPVAAVELFGEAVDDVGAVVERGFEVGLCVGLALLQGGAVAALLQVEGDAFFFELLSGLAAQLVEGGGRDEVGLGTQVL